MKNQKSNIIGKYREELLEFGYSFFKPKVLLVATKLDIFNTIGETGMPAHDIALRLNLDRDAAETFFNAMVSLGLLIY